VTAWITAGPGPRVTSPSPGRSPPAGTDALTSSCRSGHLRCSAAAFRWRCVATGDCSPRAQGRLRSHRSTAAARHVWWCPRSGARRPRRHQITAATSPWVFKPTPNVEYPLTAMPSRCFRSRAQLRRGRELRPTFEALVSRLFRDRVDGTHARPRRPAARPSARCWPRFSLSCHL
jgi:hypothetical protein